LQNVRKATGGEICAICEVVKNVRHNPQIPVRLTERQRETLRSNRSRLDKLIQRTSSAQQKKKILLQQSGRGVLLPVIAALLPPILERLFAKKQ
jgi:hypothetical protein